ncbi:hypothetical protein L7F22_034976 [Adiantum nelumboides]|nr:hypothetical protein [Adiantum nelumboides]
MASDPDPVADFAGESPSFVFRDIFSNGEIVADTGGIRAGLNAAIFPALEGQGMTMVRFRLVPCGCQLAHHHPRATEILSMVSGGPLQVGFIDTKGNAHINILNPGDVTLFPRGLLHFELNVGTEEAEYISALNSQSPGTLTAAAALFKIPTRALASSLNLPSALLQRINSTLTPNIGPILQKAKRSDCVPGRDITLQF